MKFYQNKFVKDALKFFFIVISVLIFRSVVLEPYKIPTGSMQPTLLIGDFILVNKMAYHLRVPFTDFLSQSSNIFELNRPKRGDVVVFKYPKKRSVNYIKRIIAIEDDTLEVKNKLVYLNGSPMTEIDIAGDSFYESLGTKFNQYFFKFKEVLIENKKYIIQVDTDNYFNQNYYQIKVPKGHVFVMGDNRDFSSDSRKWGFVPVEDIKGKAFLIWFSGVIPTPWSPKDESFLIRGKRIGTFIN